MKRIAALLIVVILLASIVAMGCKKGGPGTEDTTATPEDIKAKMKSGGCNIGEKLGDKGGAGAKTEEGDE